jgi:molybdenum cofactor biosynthesis enzyme MoaA
VSQFQGYIDERSVEHVAGWLRDLAEPASRLAFEVVLAGPGGERILHRGIAERFSPVLLAVGVGDGGHAFNVRFAAPLAPGERDALFVRPAGADWRAELAPDLRTTLADSVFPVSPVAANGPDAPRAGGSWQGYLDERTTHHVAGWIRDLADPSHRVEYEVVLPGPDGERVLSRGVADTYSTQLVQIGVGDGAYSFYACYPAPLTPAERDRVLVRPPGSSWACEHAPEMASEFQPISHLALDLTDNCNLRCPFCVVDYTDVRRTNLMSEATFRSALRLIPYVTTGNFWLSCLHEPTMHPRLVEFIRMVPQAWRDKLIFTTNLARRMPREYFAFLAHSGMHHLNVSLESLDPTLYERLRKGARHRIFAANWELLLASFAAGRAPPRLRYNVMAYRSNLAEIPTLVETLLTRGLAWQVEIRHTFDEEHIPQAFRDSEYLTTEEWAWLADRLAGHDPARVVLLAPPGGIGYTPGSVAADPATDDKAVGRVPITPSGALVPITAPTGRYQRIPRPLAIAMEWTGTLRIYGGEVRGAGTRPIVVNYLVTNIGYIGDPLAFLMSL